MKARPYILKETNWKTVKETKYDLAVLPWGATEAHNYHLPYGTDGYETEEIAAQSAKLAWEMGVKSIVLPTIPFGVNTQQIDIPLTVNINPSSQLVIVRDIVKNLEAQKINKLIILNGHGGNDFRFIIRELQNDSDVFMCLVNWYAVPPKSGLFEHGGDHANEMETSLMLHLYPQLVLPLKEAGEGREKRFKIKSFKEGWAWAPRQWTKVTQDTGIGNPRKANAEKGKAYFVHITQKIAEFIRQLAKINIDHIYE